MNDSRSEFVIEAREHIASFEVQLLALERTHDRHQSRLLIEHALRSIHTLKGDSGYLGLSKLRMLAHSMENVLEDYRDGFRRPTREVIEALLSARDRLSLLVDDHDHSHDANIDDVLEQLRSLESNTSSSFSLHIDLLQWSNVHPTDSMVALVHRLQSAGLWGNGTLTGLPTTDAFASSDWISGCQPRLEGTLTSRQSHADVERLLWGTTLEPAASLPTLETREVEVDLSAWRESRSSSLVGLLSSIDAQCTVTHPHLSYPEIDLSIALPSMPIVWHATLLASDTLPPETVLLKMSKTPEATIESSPVSPPKVPTANISPTVERPTAERPTADRPTADRPTADRPTVDRPMADRPIAFPESERLRSLRINVELLDRLMNLIGELTLIRNQSQVTFGNEEGDGRIIIQRLNSVTSELQDTVLQTRMQPVGNLFGRFPRMVRDLARQLNKEVEVVTQGQEVELDKTVLERLSDPLTHLIRNSIDHGIELPDVREAQGKPRSGKIHLSATPADGQVHIEIRDDGRGIDPAAIKAKALAMGLRTEAELQRMNHRELYSLILLPGFSTAKNVTDVSGRGVGMDVVKTNVEQLEGNLTIDSWHGQGTSMVLRVPLTLAIVPCLIVTVGPDRFAVPQRELEEIVCLHPKSGSRLEGAFDTEVFRLRDTLLPVIRFAEVLARTKPFTASDKADIMSKHQIENRDPTRIEYVLVLRSGDNRFGLLVDDVQGREEIVVKPMHAAMKHLPVFSGVTLMGDGQAALIVDVEGIIEHARCFAASVDESEGDVVRDPHEVHRVLLFEYGPNEQYALPLVQVRRVELLEMSRIERVGTTEFVTIDGLATRILRLSQALDVSAPHDTQTMFLILPKFVPQPMGILAHRIIDTESLAIELQSTVHESGILGTAIVRHRHTLFLDIQQLREFLFSIPSGSETKKQVVAPERDEAASLRIPSRILLVDDTPFFREVVKRYLADAQTEIVTAVDGQQGLEYLARQPFDLVVSDIEMPTMDGWQFCKSARDKGYRMPFVALTSLAKGEYEARARECGFDDFEEKLDHDRLKRKVEHWLSPRSTRSDP